ncbi:MAG: acetylxylan esterase [Pirellulaceae bacterium]
MMRLICFTTLLFSSTFGVCQDPPRNVSELFSDFDPRQTPLDIQTVRQWEADGIVYRYVTYHIATLKGRPARMAAFFGFANGETNLPGLLHLHGGGQRAFLHEVEFYAKRGYACLSINWGGREMEKAEDGDPNTDWGAVDPTQTNVPGYFNLKPGELYLDPEESPRNNNWYLLTLAAKRGLTFLEQQPQVDAQRLGVYGHSMGGNLTVYVAGTDRRVKVAAPSVGGSGFRTQPWPLLPEQRKQIPNGDLDLFNATIGFESYAPHVQAPLLWLSSTNDFHGIMDDTYRTGELIQHEAVRYAFTPHMNHRFTPEFAVTRPLWIDQHLKKDFLFPATPQSNLTLATVDHVPTFEVRPDESMPIDKVHVLYSVDPDPQARFWRTATARREGKHWTAKLPVLSVSQPLFAFANVHYQLEEPEPVPFAPPTKTFALSSMMHSVSPDALVDAEVAATDRESLVIDDFAEGWRDWYLLSPGNPHHWEFSTRKLSDPKWRVKVDCQLAIDIATEQPNELVIVISENVFRPYRGKEKAFVSVVKLQGGGETETIALQPTDFQTTDGERLSSWEHVDLLSLRAYREDNGTLFGSKNWTGHPPQFKKLRWKCPEH